MKASGSTNATVPEPAWFTEPSMPSAGPAARPREAADEGEGRCNGARRSSDADAQLAHGSPKPWTDPLN